MGGLSSILNVIALAGFGIFLAGAVLAVLAASQGRPARGGVLLAILGLIGGVLFSALAGGILIVQPTEVAVVVNTLNGTLEKPARTAGTSVIIPVVQQYYIYPLTQNSYTMSGKPGEGQVQGNDSVAARTVDGQTVALDITVIYAVDPTKVNDLHVRWQTGYQDNFVRPTVRGLVRDVVSGYKAEEIYGEKRTDMETDMQTRITDRFAQEGLTLTDLLVRDITFSDQFTQSIEDKQIADQQAQQAQLVVRQRENEADQARAVAAGQRDAAIAVAEGKAQATVLQAQAEAEALRLVSEQIAANPGLIQYLYVQNLSDNVRIITVPSNSPFLFDFNSLAQPNNDFSAPTVPDVTTPEATTTP